jgi:two-component system NtrC family sensor kinase
MADQCPLVHFIDPVSRLDTGYAVLRQNPESLTRFGDGVGKPCHQLHFGKSAPCEGCMYEQVVRNGRAERWFLAETRDEGRPPTYYEITLVPVIDEDGDVTAVQEVIRDATATLAVEQHLIELSENLGHQTHKLRGELKELQKAQAALIQTEKLASLGKLAAGLTHEIHTPLGTLISNMDVLKYEIKGVESELNELKIDQSPRFSSIRELVELHQIATDRIQKILRSLKLFAHLDRSVTEKVDLHEGIDAAISLLTYEIRGRIEVVKEYGDLPQVVCRPDAINQVFMNLLQNAVQAIPENGTITITTRAKGKNQVILEFADTGKGIPKDALKAIFDPGFTSKPRGIGTGLGLSIALQTMKAHNGTILVRSKSGKGTRFTLKLPVVQKPA